MEDSETPPFNPEGKPEQVSTLIAKQNTDIIKPSKKKGFLEGTKEKLSTYLKYKSLKVKEHFGKLNQEDFDRLLEIDFQEQLKDVPSIEGVFSPKEELVKIKNLPGEQKRKALVIFTENLTRQRKGLAACRVFIERSIEFNNDVPREKLMELVDKFGTRYGFDHHQRQISEQLIDKYLENRKKVLEIRQKYTDNRELISKLTGVNFAKNENINVSIGPMTVDIATDGFNSGRLYEGADKPTVGFNYGGFASQSIGEPPIFYIVINQDKWIRWIGYSDPSGRKTQKHEYEHQKNTLFRNVFEHQDAPAQLVGYADEQDPETKKVILENFLDESRKSAFEQAKNEITACLIDRKLSDLQYQLNDLFFKQRGDPYDYLAYLRNLEELKDDQFYQKTAQRMLVQEYETTIKKAVSSYAELVRNGGYSTQEAIALLTDKPFEDWSKTIKRLLDRKG